ncbi:4547_t:CDS:2 [Funneliformis mosseae]|uniref:4547_t:CDS:1 n=1 Tax=Funneliformis mosseae TaxID=27381 RepID=A0A9N8Z844_FUNMO|nr:4547_t:CDS:2 [Funneliformis mosseae]
MPATLQSAVRHSISTSPTRTDHYPYSPNGMGSFNNDERGGYSRQGATTNSKNNPTSMYNTMSILWKEQNPILQNEQRNLTTIKGATKAAQSSTRPSTPHNNRQKNTVEKKKPNVQAPPSKTTTVKKTKNDSPPVSPPPSLKQKSSGATNGQSSTRPEKRPVTPHATQPAGILKADKKKIDAVSSKASTTQNARRPASPPASAAHSAHSRSHVSAASASHSAHSRAHVRAASPPASAAHSAHSRSHVRAASPESALRQENRKLRRQLEDHEDLLRERDSELLEYQDLVEAFQERIRQVEARNRELKLENDIMRNYIEEEKAKKESIVNEPTRMISSVVNNIQRIRGESASSVSVAKSPLDVNSSKSSSPIPSDSPMTSPKTSFVTSKLKSQELLKANNPTKVNNSPPIRPHVVSQARGNLIPANKKTPPQDELHPPRPTAPSPAAMNRHEPSMVGGRNEMLNRNVESRDRQALGLMRKQNAALNAVMEESEDSEVDEFIFEQENDDAENDSPDDEDDESVSDFDKWSTHASSKHDLDAIVEEDDEDEDDEFDYVPPQPKTCQQKNWTPVNPIEPHFATVAKVASAGTTPPKNFAANVSGTPNNDKSSQRRVNRRFHVDSIGSDSGIGSAHEEISSVKISSASTKGQNGQTVNNGQSVFPSSSVSSKVNGKVSTQKQRSQQQQINAQDYFSNGHPSYHPHRDSMSSVNSDSSDDSASFSVSSSQNNSYPSSVTSPSSTRTDSFTSQKFANDSYGQSSSQNSNSYNNGMAQNKNPIKNGLNDIYPTSVTTTHSDNSADHNNYVQSNNKFVTSHTSAFKNGISSYTTKNSIKTDNQFNSVSKSSSGHDNYNNDNAPVTRLPSPTFATTARLSGSSVNHQLNTKRSNPNSRASTPSSNASTARAKSPASASTSRASTPASESSRNASGYTRKPRQNSNDSDSSSDNSSTAVPPSPPPQPLANNDKEPFATLQHYLRLISENSIVEDPLKTYDIKKVIDEGSSAKVYNAHPLSNPSEECAIKIVPLSYSLEFIFNEIYVLKNLKHKNIVDCKESFLRWDGKTREVWIAMEKCARGDVTNRAGKITQREVGRIAGELLSALKHLHANGVIHRDIKLSNILADANNEIKLADFGISSLTPTSTTAMVGTIPYMAPDVVLVGPDRPYDTKVDIWAIGVCILELLTGKAAWGRIRDDEIMDKLRRGEMPYGFHRLRKKADIGWEAVDFLEKCFARTPENRWSAEKLLEHPFITGNRN